MKISKQARREAKNLFRASQVDGVLDEGRVRRVVDEVLASKARDYVAVLSHFQRLVKLDLERRTARVESVLPLDGPAEASLKQTLTRRFGTGLLFQFTTNPSLIGGMRVQVGSDVFDGSVRARLAGLQESF
jgi:F-type H+-transporting ATPase subunit delta